MARSVPDVNIRKVPYDGAAICCDPITVTCTNNIATTAELNVEPFRRGSVKNVTGATVTITYNAAVTPGGYASPMRTSAIGALTQAVLHNTITDLVDDIESISRFVPTVDSASAELTFIFKS